MRDRDYDRDVRGSRPEESFNWLEEMSGSDDDFFDTEPRRQQEEEQKRLDALNKKLAAAEEARPLPPQPTVPAAVAAPVVAPARKTAEKGEEARPVPVSLFDCTNEGQDMAKMVGMGSAMEHDRSEDSRVDKEGYYSFKTGELLHGRYVVDSKFGNGVFSVVLKSKDTKATTPASETVAIKVIRANDVMTKSGMKELQILTALAKTDPEGTRNCLHLHDSFTHRGHLCLVLEAMECNLRDVLQKYGQAAGNIVGLSIAAVQSYTRQLCCSLLHLKECNVLHADFKPDNILVNKSCNALKLADFGSGMMSSEMEVTPYLVSRFYRAPEIILGLPYSFPADMWSLGATVFELFTGKMLFPGADNNHMLHLQQEVRGTIPKKLVKHAAFRDKHFTENHAVCGIVCCAPDLDTTPLQFVYERVDPALRKKGGAPSYTPPPRPVKMLLSQVWTPPLFKHPHTPFTPTAQVSCSPEEKLVVENLRDFIEQATAIDPSYVILNTPSCCAITLISQASHDSGIFSSPSIYYLTVASQSRNCTAAAIVFLSTFRCHPRGCCNSSVNRVNIAVSVPVSSPVPVLMPHLTCSSIQAARMLLCRVARRWSSCKTWRFGDVGAVIMHRSSYTVVKQAFVSAQQNTRRLGKHARVAGWMNKAGGVWKEEENMIMAVTPIAAAALQGVEGYDVPESVEKVQSLFEWQPGLRRPSHLRKNGLDLSAENNYVCLSAKESRPVPDKATSFSFTDLFSGIGGFRLGCEEVGGRCLFSAEADAHCRRVYYDNFGHFPEGDDVSQVAASQMPFEHALLTGGFPCGPFTWASAKNRAGFLDPRGLLYLQISRLLRCSRPKAFLLENVPGVREEASIITKELEEAGYVVSMHLVNAVHIVPQVRKRIFFVGFRKDLVDSDFVYTPPPLPEFRRAFQDVEERRFREDAAGLRGVMADVSPKDAWSATRKRADYLVPVGIFNRMMKSATGLARCRQRSITRDEPISTLMASYKANPELYSQLVDNERFLTERECARSQGFPDSFGLTTPVRSYHQLGNAVPPPVVSILAHHVVSTLNGETSFERAVLPGWAAAARLALQATNDPSALGSVELELPDASVASIRDLTAFV